MPRDSFTHDDLRLATDVLFSPCAINLFLPFVPWIRHDPRHSTIVLYAADLSPSDIFWMIYYCHSPTLTRVAVGKPVARGAEISRMDELDLA